MSALLSFAGKSLYPFPPLKSGIYIHTCHQEDGHSASLRENDCYTLIPKMSSDERLMFFLVI